MNTRMYMAAGFAVLMASTGGVAAQEKVRVQSHDGSVVLTGELVSFDEKDLIVRAQFGDLTVARALVSCEGEGCPPDA